MDKFLNYVTVEDLEKIKQEYINYSGYFLCHASEIFDTLYITYVEEIRNLALIFLKGHAYEKSIFVNAHSLLLFSAELHSITFRKQVRVDFFDFLIELKNAH